MSRRAVLEEESSEEREQLLATLQEGQEISVWLRILLSMVLSLIWAALMVFFTLPTCHGNVSNTQVVERR